LSRAVKAKAYELRKKGKADLMTQLSELRTELAGVGVVLILI
jgi:ribosomal protein L29